METIFIGTVVVALTQILKALSPKVAGVLTILAAAIIGGLVGLLDVLVLGLPTDISIAEGVLIGLGSAGVVYTAGRINTHER